MNGQAFESGDGRGRLMVSGLAAILLLLCARFAYLQVCLGAYHARLAHAQHAEVLPEPHYRGDIRFADGTLACRSIHTVSAFVDPAHVRDPAQFALEVGTALSFDAERKRRLFERIITAGSRRFIWVRRRLTPEVAEAALDIHLPGLHFRGEERRLYPRGSLAGNVLGLLSADGMGATGVEAALEPVLSGVSGFRETLRDGAGESWKDAGALRLAPFHGATVRLTIDPYLQEAAEEAVLDLASRHGPRGIAALALEPATGKVRALASWPVLDPSDPDGAPPDAFRNRVIHDAFEPGSTMKGLIAAWALELECAEASYDCSHGAWRYRGRLLHDHHPFGRLSFDEVVVKSSNIGMAKIGLAIGALQLQHLFAALGFGRQTGIRLPAEVTGRVPSPAKWSYWTTTSVPMGHEIMVTPLQLALAYCALVNGGVRVAPLLVEEVRHGGRRVVLESDPRAGARIFSPRVSRRMVDILVRVVEEGTGKKARIQGVRVGGKTGTAEKYPKESKKYVSSFLGFAPAEAPRLVVLVMVDEPRDGYYGGTVAAPAVKRILEADLARAGMLGQKRREP